MSEPVNGGAPRAERIGAGTGFQEPASTGGAAVRSVRTAPTGNDEVDSLIERLGAVGALPTRSHIDVYEDVHRGLRDALTALDDNRS
jgi:hypothetical protein